MASPGTLLLSALLLVPVRGGDVFQVQREDGGWPIPLVTFGLIADPHANIKHRQPWWCDHACWKKEVKLAASKKGRKHHTVMKKIEESVEVLSRVPGISFSVDLGDLCDMDMMVNMPPVLEVWNRLPHPHYNLMGNHDLRGENDRFGEPAKLRNKTQISWLLRKWNLNDTFYYSFSRPPYRFIVLDSMTLPPTTQAGVLKDKQVQWLQQELSASSLAKEDVIIFAHIPIGLQSNAIRHVLLKYDNILAIFHGHKHSGGYGWHETGKHLITLQGMIETDLNAFAYVNLFIDRMELVGFGRVPSRVYFKTDVQLQRALARPMAAYAPLLAAYRSTTSFSQNLLEAWLSAASTGKSAKDVFPMPFGRPKDLTQKVLQPLDQQANPVLLRSYPVVRPQPVVTAMRNMDKDKLPSLSSPSPSPTLSPRKAQEVTSSRVANADHAVHPSHITFVVFISSVTVVLLMSYLRRKGRKARPVP